MADHVETAEVVVKLDLRQLERTPLEELQQTVMALETVLEWLLVGPSAVVMEMVLVLPTVLMVTTVAYPSLKVLVVAAAMAMVDHF